MGGTVYSIVGDHLQCHRCILLWMVRGTIFFFFGGGGGGGGGVTTYSMTGFHISDKLVVQKQFSSQISKD